MLATRPTVAVEIHPDPFVEAHAHAKLTTMRGWLVRRLLEEGYDVAADPAAAHGVLRVRAAGDGLVVEAEGHARRSYAIEDGPDAVVRLEVLHHALIGVEQTCDAREALAGPRLGLALRFGEDQPHEALLEAVAVAAQVAGVTLAASPRPGDTLACVEARGSLAEVSLGPAEADCGPPVLVLELGDGSPTATRSAARALIEAVRVPVPDDAPLDPRSLGGPPPGVPMPPPVLREEGDPVAMHGPPRAEIRLGASAGVMSRGQWADPLVQAGWRMGKINGIGGRLSVSVAPTRAHSLWVVDSRLAIGPDWEIRAGRRGHVDVAALVGTDLHTFANDTRTAGDVAFAAEVPVSYSLSMGGGGTRLQLSITPGISSQAWQHTRGLLRDDPVVWRRPLWRIGFGVGITHGWRIE